MLMRNDKDVIMNFELGEYTRKRIFQSVTQAARKEKSPWRSSFKDWKLSLPKHGTGALSTELLV